MKRPLILFVLICLLTGAAAAQTAAPAGKQEALVGKQAAREQKAREKAQKKQIREEINQFKQLRNAAVLEFAKTHPPKMIVTPPLLGNDLRVSNVVCVGDNLTGTVMVYLDITPMFGTFSLYMGGERNGTDAHAKGNTYPSADMYGRVYTLRSGIPEQISVTFYNITPGTGKLDQVDISMGLSLFTLNIISLCNVPIYWTYSDQIITGYVRAGMANQQTKQLTETIK